MHNLLRKLVGVAHTLIRSRTFSTTSDGSLASFVPHYGCPHICTLVNANRHVPLPRGRVTPVMYTPLAGGLGWARQQSMSSVLSQQGTLNPEKLLDLACNDHSQIETDVTLGPCWRKPWGGLLGAVGLRTEPSFYSGTPSKETSLDWEPSPSPRCVIISPGISLNELLHPCTNAHFFCIPLLRVRRECVHTVITVLMWSYVNNNPNWYIKLAVC